MSYAITNETTRTLHGAIGGSLWCRVYSAPEFVIMVADSFDMPESFCNAVEAIYLTGAPTWKWRMTADRVSRDADDTAYRHVNGDCVAWARTWSGCGFLIMTTPDFTGSKEFHEAIVRIVAGRDMAYEEDPDAIGISPQDDPWAPVDAESPF